MATSSKRQDSVRTPRQDRSQQRVEQILGAAKLLILEHGCAGLKMSDIAKTAEVSIGSIYQYFPNKHAIVAGLAQDYLALFEREVEQALAEPASDLDSLFTTIIGLLHRYYRMHRDDPVVRDIWIGSATDKTLQDIDANAAARNQELLFDRSKHLFDSSQHEAVQRVYTLATSFATSAVSIGIEQDKQEGQQTMMLAEQMLLACWDNLIKPLAKD